ncbi:DUF1833 domain-containing protein [Burkholderia sp. Bp9017]|uniref:DUF1833 family protein n=1 Tax=unclassified Burkholderia TaxID=2613784 RepID=UPI000F5F7E54|nr:MULTISPECIES: DUF1833 family protein [unclassified Burkholderia]RQZ24166.1 DUF1833 domain-containing protein [Burkholderia sp. Bp9017]RQZ32136.1 DUF1833 domain-containing protein [Burkholderia sp. Bp9016]
MATIDEALAEVYASNPQDDFVLNTLELRHPSFIDDAGNPTAIRVVAGHDSLVARLESDAPLDAAQMVRFEAMAFNFKLPSMQEGQAPELQITLDGVSGEVVEHLENAVTMTADVEVTFRRFLAASPEAGPRDGRPITLYASMAKATLTQVTMTANLTDIHNKAFPWRTYLPAVFPGLVRGS